MNGAPFIGRESVVGSLAGGGVCVCAGARSDRVELSEE